MFDIPLDRYTLLERAVAQLVLKYAQNTIFYLNKPKVMNTNDTTQHKNHDMLSESQRIEK